MNFVALSQHLAYSGKVHHLRGHEGPITCLVACKPYSIVVSGSTDCTCIIWDINRSGDVHMIWPLCHVTFVSIDYAMSIPWMTMRDQSPALL